MDPGRRAASGQRVADPRWRTPADQGPKNGPKSPKTSAFLGLKRGGRPPSCPWKSPPVPRGAGGSRPLPSFEKSSGENRKLPPARRYGTAGPRGPPRCAYVGHLARGEGSGAPPAGGLPPSPSPVPIFIQKIDWPEAIPCMGRKVLAGRPREPRRSALWALEVRGEPGSSRAPLPTPFFEILSRGSSKLFPERMYGEPAAGPGTERQSAPAACLGPKDGYSR